MKDIARKPKEIRSEAQPWPEEYIVGKGASASEQRALVRLVKERPVQEAARISPVHQWVHAPVLKPVDAFASHPSLRKPM